MSPRRPLLVAVVVVSVLLAAGCGGSDPPAPPAGRIGGSITVFAAASLTEVFEELAESFEVETGGEVRFNFGPSSGLAVQIGEGAPADVFASADQPNAAKVADRSRGETVTFATNELKIIVEAGNPLGIRSLADLARRDIVFVTANPDVPIGRYAAEALSKAGVKVVPRSFEADVRAIVAKVTLGEADAGIVYATDVSAVGDRAEGVDIPAGSNVVAAYPAVRLTDGSGSMALADAFIAYLTAPAGRAVLTARGFGPP